MTNYRQPPLLIRRSSVRATHNPPIFKRPPAMGAACFLSAPKERVYDQNDGSRSAVPHARSSCSVGGFRYASRANLRDADRLKASELAPAALLKGPFHSVDENVTIVGAQANFIIRSQYGTWEARGHEMLASMYPSCRLSSNSQKSARRMSS